MEETYKDCIIKYRETTNTFRAEIGDSSYSNPSLEKVKKYIDNLERKDFKRTNVILSTWGNDYTLGVVTSEVSKSEEVWISYKDTDLGSSRRKQHINNVFLDSPQNRAILEQIAQKHKEIEILRLDITKCHSEFERYKLGQ